MAKITIEDFSGSADLKVGEGSLAGKSITRIGSTAANLVKDLSRSIKDVEFQSANLGAVLQSPKIAINAAESMTVKTGTNCTLTRYTAKDKTLLGKDPSVPQIDIGPDDYWMSFALQGTLDLAGSGNLGSGFGVSLKFGSTLNLTEYTRFSPADGPLPTLGEAIGITLTDFGLLASAAEIRGLQPGTVRSADVSGTVTVSGSYSLPMAVNQLALAESVVPFKIAVKPDFGVKLGGSVALTGDYSVLCWRNGPTQIVLAVMKKKGTTLTATFNAGAGLAASMGGGDLIEPFFNAVAPGIDLAKCGLAKDDPRYKAINDVLTESVSRAFSVSVNAKCAAAFTDQAALVYSVDLTEGSELAKAATNAALDAALAGDWSQLSTLPNAKELCNAIADSHEHKFTFAVNLIGIFSYETIADFVSSSTVVRDAESLSVTITDSQTAKRITTAATPYLADPNKLRTVLYESTVATAAYKLASGNLSPADLKLTQQMLIYKSRLSPADLRKDLRLAVAIAEMTGAQLDAIPMANPSHVRVEANQALDNDHLLKVFFADPTKHTPHTVPELALLGRRTLAALLDPANIADARRIAVLNSDQIWAAMDVSGGKAPADSPASYSDWCDVTFWANAIHGLAKPLQAVLEAWQHIPAGSDPTKAQNFMKARDTLKKAVGEAVHDTHAAFETGWPIAVMYALSGGNTGATLKAMWSGIAYLPIAQAATSSAGSI